MENFYFTIQILNNLILKEKNEWFNFFDFKALEDLIHYCFYLWLELLEVGSEFGEVMLFMSDQVYQ